MQTTKVTIEDLNTISKIAERAVALYAKVGLRADLVVMADNVLVVHKEVVPLRLQEMLVADDGNFAHDIGGIARHLERTPSGARLNDCFLPRFAAQ
jgi:hypothetical protein